VNSSPPEAAHAPDRSAVRGGRSYPESDRHRCRHPVGVAERVARVGGVRASVEDLGVSCSCSRAWRSRKPAAFSVARATARGRDQQQEMPRRARSRYSMSLPRHAGRRNEEQPAIRERRPAREWTVVERFAESVASHVLIPERVLQGWLGTHRRQGLAPRRVRSIARRFKVTPLAMATRLRESGFMTWTQYNAWREEWDAYVARFGRVEAGSPPRSKRP